MIMIKRIYKGKDVEMLTTNDIMIDNAIADQVFLSSKRSTWTIEFFTGIKTRIGNAFTHYLGIDSDAQQRLATKTLYALVTSAIDDLSEVKIQIGEDYKSDKPRRNELLRVFGYAAYFNKARAKDQEALVELLAHFKTGLTEEIKTELTTKGTSAETRDRIVGYAEPLKQANETQEILKGDSKGVSAEAVTEFNAIYSECISIGKIASNFHKGDSVMRDKFSYSKILKSLNAAPRKKGEEKK